MAEAFQRPSSFTMVMVPDTCAAAGLSVQRPGGISSVPGKEEILALLAAGD